MNELRIEWTEDADGEHRWHAQAANGRILGHGGEGFHNLADCEGNAELTLRALLNDLATADDIVSQWFAERQAALSAETFAEAD